MTQHLKYEKYTNDDYSFFEKGHGDLNNYTEQPVEGTNSQSIKVLIDKLLLEKIPFSKDEEDDQ